jgi:AraC-like DNA-binding protein
MCVQATTTTRRREHAALWRIGELGNLEVLHATFVTQSFPRHTHDTFAIGMNVQGTKVYTYEGGTTYVPAGGIIVTNPGDVHAGHAADDQGCTYQNAYPDVALLQQIVSEVVGRVKSAPAFPQPIIHDPALFRLLRDLHRSFAEPEAALECQSRLVWTYAQLLTRHAAERPIPPPLGREHHAVRRVRDYLAAHLAENVTLDQLAQVTDLSAFHLLRVFRAAVGLPPHAYLTQLRVAHAKRRLVQGQRAVQVAAESGFVDQSHLTKHFKRLVGVTPGQYAAAVMAASRFEQLGHQADEVGRDPGADRSKSNS